MGVVRVSEIVFKNKIGQQLCICGMLQKCESRPMKSGNQSLILQIQDKDKEIELRWFDVLNIDTSFLICGEIYAFTVEIKEYAKGKDGISVIIYNNEVCRIEADKNLFLNWEDNLEWARGEIRRFMDMVYPSDIGKLTIKLIEGNWGLLSKLPAASSMHHNGLGGLSLHIAGVASLSEKICEFYSGIYGCEFINKTLLICGALLHDIGKIKELELDPTSSKAQYSLMGKLGTHIMHGISMITACAVEMGINDTQEVQELLHLIGSHHGELEYGSPLKPNCIEADILNKADEMDAVAYRRSKAYSELGYGEGNAEWKMSGLFVNYRATMEFKMPIL